MKTPAGFASLCGRVSLVLCLFVAVAQPTSAFDDPPMRVARLNYVAGQVSFQPGGETDWGWATVNRPLTAGDSLWTGNSSRAERNSWLLGGGGLDDLESELGGFPLELLDL